jgi:hypothetical protein
MKLLLFIGLAIFILTLAVRAIAAPASIAAPLCPAGDQTSYSCAAGLICPTLPPFRKCNQLDPLSSMGFYTCSHCVGSLCSLGLGSCDALCSASTSCTQCMNYAASWRVPCGWCSALNKVLYSALITIIPSYSKIIVFHKFVLVLGNHIRIFFYRKV